MGVLAAYQLIRPMKQDALQNALLALEERQRTNEEVLSHHLSRAQEQVGEAQKRLAAIEERVDRILGSLGAALADGPEAGADQPSLERKLDRLERGLAPAHI